MRTKNKNSLFLHFISLSLSSAFLLYPCFGFSELTLKEGQIIERSENNSQEAGEHYHHMMQYYETREWTKLQKEATALVRDFATSPFSEDASFFLAVSFYEQKDYDLANDYFTKYLTKQTTPKYFQDSIHYKFQIAEQFRKGARTHLFGSKFMPKVFSAPSGAITIYDEVIAAIPHDELAAQSLYGKGQVLFQQEDFRLAIESFQTLIRRFPKHALAVESYISIGEVYFQQSKSEYPDPDYLSLAELNLSKFRSSFPGEEKIAVAIGNYGQMLDHYASTLFETARFYERTSRWGAAKIYYEKIVKSYPDSRVAQISRDRLSYVESKVAKQALKKANS